MNFKAFLISFSLIVTVSLSMTAVPDLWQALLNFSQSFSKRVPSSVRGINTKDLKLINENLILESEIKYINGDAYISLGNLETKNDINICAIYESLQLQFLSGDLFINGRPSELKIKSKCILDNNKLGAIYIPFSKINELQPTSQKIEQESLIQFKNIAGEWPKVWHLNSIRGYTYEGQIKVILNTNDLFNIKDKKINLEL